MVSECGVGSACQDLNDQVHTLLEALVSNNFTSTNSSLLRRLFNCSTSATGPEIVCAEDLQAACEIFSQLCMFLNDTGSKANVASRDSGAECAVAGFRLVPVCMQTLQRSYQPIEMETLLHPHLIAAIATFLKLAQTCLLSKEWLQTAGQDVFAATASVIRSSIKDCVVPMLSSLASHEHNLGSTAILEPFEQLVTIGRLSADILAGRLEHPQELRSFTLLNLAWSSIVKLLLIIAKVPDQAFLAKIAKSFHVARLLQLLIGYCRSEFDKVLQQANLNQLQVVRFWTQHVIKISTSFRGVGQSMWGTLTGTLAWMHQEVLPLRSDSWERHHAIYTEAQQHVLPRFSNLAVACLPETPESQDTICPWLYALSHNTDADALPYPTLASQSIGGRFMVMLDILRHGASLTAAAQLQCAKHGLPFIFTILGSHMSAQACNELPLRKEVDKAVLLFMAACCSKREGTAWQECELFLFKQAMLPHPIRLCCLSHIWSAVLRHSASSLAASHVSILHRLLVAAAVQSDAATAVQQINSMPVRQMVQLIAHLVSIVTVEHQQTTCESMLKACDTMKTPVEQAAARAVTFSVFQLVSSLPNPILLPTTALQELQQMSQAARLASDTNCGWHLLSLAAALQYCQQEGIKEAEGEALQILGFAVGKLHQADQHSHSAVCALQVLVVAQHMCTPHDLAENMRGLLHLQQNKQAAASVAAVAGQYAEAQAPPVQLFHAILEEQHWALQHEAMQSLLTYSRSPKSGDFRQILPRSLYDSDSSESPSAAFKAIFLEHMQRAPPAAPVLAGDDLTQGCQRLEHQAARAWQSILQQDRYQAAEAEPVLQQHLPNKLDVAIVNASQAMQELSQCLAADMPGKADERSAQVHTQLMLLAQIAQQCSTARPS